MSHKKKDFDSLAKGKYPRETLRAVVRDVLNGKTTPQQAYKDHAIPIRTIQHHVKLARESVTADESGKYEDIPTVKDFMGPDPSLDADLEERIRLYIRDMFPLGMPRSQQKFLNDIETYLKTFDIHVPRFKNGRPGPDYLRRLSKGGNGMDPVHLLSASEVTAYLFEEKEINSWIGVVKQYLLDVNGELIRDKKLIFFIDTQVFLTNTNPKRAVSVMVIYNAECRLIRWIIVSDGSVLSHEWTEEQKTNAMFLLSTDGRLSLTTLRNALIMIARHYEEAKLDGVALVFLDHFIANEFDFCNWDYCFSNSIYPMAIPRTISSGLRSLNLGVMPRYTSLMLFFMQNRFILMNYECDEMNFVLMHKEAVFQVSAKSNLPTALNMMKISKLVMKQKAVVEEDVDKNDPLLSDGPSTSSIPVSPVAHLPASPKVVRKKGKKVTKLVEVATAATQTAPEVISVNLASDDIDFDLFKLQSMRQNFLVTTVREQDFN